MTFFYSRLTRTQNSVVLANWSSEGQDYHGRQTLMRAWAQGLVKKDILRTSPVALAEAVWVTDSSASSGSRLDARTAAIGETAATQTHVRTSTSSQQSIDIP